MTLVVRPKENGRWLKKKKKKKVPGAFCWSEELDDDVGTKAKVEELLLLQHHT